MGRGVERSRAVMRGQRQPSVSEGAGPGLSRRHGAARQSERRGGARRRRRGGARDQGVSPVPRTHVGWPGGTRSAAGLREKARTTSARDSVPWHFWGRALPAPPHAPP